MRKRTFLLVCFISLLLVGCARCRPTHTATDINKSDLVEIGYLIVDKLIDNLHSNLNTEQCVLVACFVDVNNVQRSSNFGRMLPEHMVSRLAQNGYTVVEMKLRDSIYIKEGAGEFLLSRRIKDISSAHNAQAVVVGTYLLAPKDLYIAARIVQADSARIISSCDLRLPLSDELRTMVY